jgi:hypothetical protein
MGIVPGELDERDFISSCIVGSLLPNESSSNNVIDGLNWEYNGVISETSDKKMAVKTPR